MVLCHLEDLTYRDAAAVLSVPESTVRGRLTRARAALLHRLQDWA